MKFRPCIDLHNGQVKQIVGSTLNDEKESPALNTNFETDRPSKDYAKMYEKDKLLGGHVIMLGPGNKDAAKSALQAYPQGLQVGGGVNDTNATLECHSDRHLVFRYCVHWGRHKGSVQPDIAGQIRRDIDITDSEMDVSWHHNEIIVCIGNTGGVFHEYLGCRKTTRKHICVRQSKSRFFSMSI